MPLAALRGLSEGPPARASMRARNEASVWHVCFGSCGHDQMNNTQNAYLRHFACVSAQD